ncbi:exonuclease domain-containing protein [Favolaschia claudopus]|uniref:Exonuclease domain-containing protein n=1 Tax=Favolaschia claudopus TaxID=2862362 RepID=A0AAW0EE93_9AGAR
MFSSLQLFQRLPCPDSEKCTRPQCLFSHRTDLPRPPTLVVPIERPVQSEKSTIPAKRPVPSTSSSPSRSATQEPPRKQQKLASSRPAPVKQELTSGPPVLRVNGAQSMVPIPVRQTMLKTLYDHFVVLYDAILPANPTLASEHALRQEDEIYKKSSKQTYRVAVIHCAAALKRRPVPDVSSHSSVGTEEEVITRAEALKTRQSLRLTRAHIEHLLVSKEDLKLWGFLLDIPDGPGGNEPSLENKMAKCDRCGKAFLVKRKDEAGECIFHWGKPITRTASGQRERVFRCCYRPAPGDDEGCSHGPHVFYESKPEDLHSRHAFSYLKPHPSQSTVLDVAALDCEMIYTTGGMRVARVSGKATLFLLVVDGAGKEVFDEFVRMDEGVEIIDFNTRFSGITEADYAKAVLPLASIRDSLDALINADTVLIGHALDNDLNTLRIVHYNVVDTALIFKHNAGPPYRKALRDLAREHLGITIQSGGGSVGHSSVEDSIATLDLMSFSFGQQDLNMLRSAPGTNDFQHFKFNTIGKQPELLKRISFGDGAQYDYSPSPEPEARYQQYSPSPEPETLPPHTETVRTRPSLLQALTSNSGTQEPPTYSISAFNSRHPQQQQQLQPTEEAHFSADFSAMDDESMNLQYPETPVPEDRPPAMSSRSSFSSRPPAPLPPPFIPDYAALKELHTRLETARKVLAAPPPPKKPPTPPPDFPSPSLIAANNAVHHGEKTCITAKEALKTSQARVTISEQSVAAAQTVVDNLTRALAAAHTSLEAAQKTLVEARKAAEEAQAALLSSQAAAGAAEETKRLLEEPPPPRAPTPEPVNNNAELIQQMEKDLDAVQLWVEKQEAGHSMAAAAHTDMKKKEEKAARRTSSLSNGSSMPIHTRTNSGRAQLAVTEHTVPAVTSDSDMDLDEPRRLEEDAAQALVALAEQRVTTQERVRELPAKDLKQKGKAAKVKPVEASASEAALEREAVLRKQQEARREQVRIQKEQAHAAAALSILKERQDAAAKSNGASQHTPPADGEPSQPQRSGSAVARDPVLPPTQGKGKAKKSKPVSGGVKLGPDAALKLETTVAPDVLTSSDFSPALERAAALGLRVRSNAVKAPDSASASVSKTKKTRNQSLPPVTVDERDSPEPEDISVYRTGSDPGDIPIISVAPELPPNVSSDVQLMNLRFALQDEGIPWEAISRSRPLRKGIKMEEVEPDVRTVPSAPLQPKPAPASAQLPPSTKPAPAPAQRPPAAKPVVSTPAASDSTAASTSTAVPKPPPSKKQLPKFNKTPQAGTSGKPQASQPPPLGPSPSVYTKPRLNGSTIAAQAATPSTLSPAAPPVATRPKPQATSSKAALKAARALARAQAVEPRPSNADSRLSTPAQASIGSSSGNRSLNDRVSDPWRPRSPLRRRSQSPDRDGHARRGSNSYNVAAEPATYDRRRTPDWAGPPSPPSWGGAWGSPAPRSPSPRSRPPPRRPSPSPHRRGGMPKKQAFAASYEYSAYNRPPAVPSPPAYYSPQDSPPQGPRAMRTPVVHHQKRARDREDDYASPPHPQKRFREHSREGYMAYDRGVEELDRPSLENRLGAPASHTVHYIGRGESYRPADDYEWPQRSDDLLSRLSEPARGRGNPRGRGSLPRGGTRGRGNKSRGRGRGEVSLAARLH